MKNALYEMEKSTDVSDNNSTTEENPGLDGEHASRFRVIAYVLQAVRRFKNSLNPTITFKKRPSEELPPRAVSEGANLRQNTSQYRTMSGRLKQTGSRRVTTYLFQPLPEVESK
ncbi:hypothetical protein BSKO_13147 [Bryopsis sp. KO-2023]|nr:hypothetical protein BSKO_13147 [Bryopsis sp. KO-2023]